MKSITLKTILLLFITSCTSDPPIPNYSAYLENEEFQGCRYSEVRDYDEASNLSRLRVVGNQLVDNNCDIVELKGVAVEDPLFIYGLKSEAERELYLNRLLDLNPGIIRIPVHPGLIENYTGYFNRFVDPLVQWCNKHNIYAFVGYHAHGNPISGETEMPAWRNNFPWKGNPFNANFKLAQKSLFEMAYRYQRKPWVIYGTFNEPAYVEWQEFRPYVERLIDTMHSVNPELVVTVSGTNFGFELDRVVYDPVKRKNVVYETHAYPWKGPDWKNQMAVLREYAPVMIGEWGYVENENGVVEENYALPLLKKAEAMKLSWCAWVFSDSWYPQLLNDEGYTGFGAVVADELD